MTYPSLYFGRKGGPGNWGVISSLRMQFVAERKPANSPTHGSGSFEAFQFVDYGGYAEPALGLRPLMCVGLWERALTCTFGPDALNKDKKRAEGKYSTNAPMWGAVVDTELELVSTPSDKVLKAQHVLSDHLLGPGVTRITINLIRKLRGMMEFRSACFQQIRTEFDRLPRGRATPIGAEWVFFPKRKRPPNPNRLLRFLAIC